MSYYIFVQNDKLNGCGQGKLITEDVINVQVEEAFFLEYNNCPEKYVWDGREIIENADYEQEQLQKEKERIAMLSLTKREVFLGLYEAKGITPEQLKAQVTDPKALIEIEYANEYYRGNPLIDIIGQQLGITSEQLDKFFETNDYTNLL